MSPFRPTAATAGAAARGCYPPPSSPRRSRSATSGRAAALFLIAQGLLARDGGPSAPASAVAAIGLAVVASVAAAAARALPDWRRRSSADRRRLLRGGAPMTTMLWQLLIILVLILLNGFFAMSELAVVSSRRARLRHLAERRRRGAAAALRLVEDPGRFLSTVQVGITLVGIFAGAYGGATLAEGLGEHLDRVPTIAPHGEEVALALVVVVITYLTLILGELVPKRIALTDAEGIAARVARPMRLLSRAAAPVVWLLGASTDLALRLLRVPATPESTVTEEEVRMMIAEGTQRGVFEPAEREMIDGVLRLADRTVRSIMTPRPEIVWLDPDDDPAAVRREIRESGFSRFLVSRGAVDEVLGVVQTKDLLDRALRGRPLDLMACLREPLIVHDGTPVLRLLDLFKQSGVQFAVVVDEYGSVEGLATLTDILETIAGEIPEPGEEAEPWAVRRDDGSWLIDGMAPIDQVEARIGLRGLRGEDGGFHTLAGFVLARLRRMPTPGDHVEWRGARFEVVDMDGRRIDKVLVVPPPPPEAEEDAAALE